MDHHIELLDTHVSYKGEQRFYRDRAEPLGREVELAIYVPVASLLKERHCPVLYYLPELGSSARETANQSDYQRYANRYDIILVVPDVFAHLRGSSGEQLAAYQQDRKNIEQYLTQSLPRVLEHHFRTFDAWSLMGYGFGGTVALDLALRHPGLYRGVSLYAPWLGFHGSLWYQELGVELPSDIDPLSLLETGEKTLQIPLWLDQGDEDPLLGQQIQYEAVQRVLGDQPVSCTLNTRKRYDHSFFFVHSHTREHIVFHDDCYDGVEG
ncbi:MAG: alpha/beta hydrolase-fold protein [Cardiobacteriaceae bacterium]|nr:alpha/beta hydrolase-fold protein [Cardiobacteriaceae bacterium]